jgi:FHA domain
MKTCSYCGRENVEGSLYCAQCDKPLGDAPTVKLSTRQIADIESGLTPKQNWGTARFEESASVFVHVRGAAMPIVLEPRAEMILGRADAKTGFIPDIDFTEYGAEQNGVSRQHAVLLRAADSLTLIDKGSANGTYLNGQRLVPDQPRILCDGDEVRLGTLVCHFYFNA